MENIVKWVRRFIPSAYIVTVYLLILATVALATPALVTGFVGVVSSENISLTWVRASGASTTVIRHSTTGFPASPASGTETYNGTGSYTMVSGLSSGTTYYFSAWGYDGAYSVNATQLALTTSPVVSENTTIPYPRPSMPAVTWQDPDSSGWSIDPIDKVIDWFADPSATRGGLGMPVNNVIMFITGMIATGVALVTYVRWRSFYTSWVILMMLCSFFSTIEAMQWIVVGFLILAGAGVWAVDKATQ